MVDCGPGAEAHKQPGWEIPLCQPLAVALASSHDLSGPQLPPE